jgi:hypothetical protein
MMNTLEAAIRALSKSKMPRAEATTAEAASAIHASADLLDLEACKAHAGALEQARSAAIAANKPDTVIDIDGKWHRARVAVEIAAVRAAGSTAKHAECIVATAAARIEVERCARAVIDSKMISLAAKITSELDDAVALGAQLQALSTTNFLNTPLNAAVRSVPVEVTRALERLPKRNPYDIPVNELRDGASGAAWQKLFAELTADDEPIDVAA